MPQCCSAQEALQALGNSMMQDAMVTDFGEGAIAANSETLDYFAPHWGASFQGYNSPSNGGQWAPAAAPENSSAIFYMTDSTS